MIVMATGLGKTIVFSELIHRWRRAGRISSSRPAVVIAHREELLQQAADKIFNSAGGWIPIGIERASERAPITSEVIVASVQTVGRPNNGRLDGVVPGLIIIDECHHVAAASYQHALQKLGAFDRDDVYTLGVTATPYRLDNRSISGKNGTFEAEVYRSDILSGIDNGYLCDLRLFSVQTGTDLTGVRKRGDDFVESDLAKVLNNNKGRTLEAIKAWQEHAADRRTIVFCPSVEHAMDTAELWKGQAGVPSACIHGGTDPAIRRDVMTMFRRGRIQVLCNVDIATEGFDVPEIGCIVMLKPTLSWTKYIQMIGRGTRTAAGKQDCIVLDMVDLAAEHSICTIPAMVGLPASIDLKGTSMRQAASRAESVTEEVADALKAIAKGRKELPTLDDIEIATREVNLRQAFTGSMKKVKASAYSWTKMADGSFVISTQVGVAKITFDAVGNGRLIISDARKNVTSSDLTPGVDAHKAVIEAEKIVLNAFGKKALEYKKRNAPWKRSTDQPSEAQKNLLLRLGVRKESLSGLNKATASQMIDKIMAERAVRKAGI
jgi:superfamily II DNA or RNA helicase